MGGIGRGCKAGDVLRSAAVVGGATFTYVGEDRLSVSQVQYYRIGMSNRRKYVESPANVSWRLRSIRSPTDSNVAN